MLELGVVALATFFVTVGPVDVAVVFAVLSQGMTRAQRRRVAWRAALLATAILMLFALFGEAVLSVLGITIRLCTRPAASCCC